MNVVLNLELILQFFFSTLKIQYQNKTIGQFKAVIKQEKKHRTLKPQRIMTIQQDVFFQIIQNKFHWCNNLIESETSLKSNHCVFRVLHGVSTGAGRVRPCPCRGLRGRWCIPLGSSAPWSVLCRRWYTCSRALQSQPKSCGSFQTWERISNKRKK